jgi:hypothetical protein
VEDWVRLVGTLQATLDAVERLGGSPVVEFTLTDGSAVRRPARSLSIGAPAYTADVERVERALGAALPAALTRFFLECARSIDFSWFCPENLKFPAPFEANFSGGFSLSLDSLQDCERGRRHWIEHCFPNPSDPYDAVWHQKLAIIPVIDGDCIGLDLRPDYHGEVVYLSHCDSKGHGYVLGTDILDFLRRWTPLGCPGPEDWQWLPFTSSRTSMLEPDGEAAREWRNIVGLEVGRN